MGVAGDDEVLAKRQIGVPLRVLVCGGPDGVVHDRAPEISPAIA